MLYTSLDINQQFKLEAAFDGGADWLLTGYLVKVRGQAAIVRIDATYNAIN